MRRRLLLMSVLLTTACGGSGGSDSAPTSLPIATPGPAAPAPAPAPAPSPAPTGLECTAADTVEGPERLRVTLAAGEARIVAIGSSSTLGTGASAPSASYPSVLAALLAQAPSPPTYEVLNKGRGGDLLPDIVGRLDRDALGLSPQLVALQTGVNDATAAGDAESLRRYADQLRATVLRLKAGTAVVLISGQFYPAQPAHYEAFQDATRRVGAETGVAVFDRYGLMKRWISSGRYRFVEVLAADNFHPNDLTYRCMAQVMADLTRRGVAGAG